MPEVKETPAPRALNGETLIHPFPTTICQQRKPFDSPRGFLSCVRPPNAGPGLPMKLPMAR